jgi:hypothetical protein
MQLKATFSHSPVLLYFLYPMWLADICLFTASVCLPFCVASRECHPVLASDLNSLISTMLARNPDNSWSCCQCQYTALRKAHVQERTPFLFWLVPYYS